MSLYYIYVYLEIIEKNTCKKILLAAMTNSNGGFSSKSTNSSTNVLYDFPDLATCVFKRG